jgi:gas vesicle protein
VNTRDALIGLAAGVILGGALGLLYAPRPGPETRASAAEKAQALKEAAAERVRHLPPVIFIPISISVSTSKG